MVEGIIQLSELNKILKLWHGITNSAFVKKTIETLSYILGQFHRVLSSLQMIQRNTIRKMKIWNLHLFDRFFADSVSCQSYLFHDTWTNSIYHDYPIFPIWLHWSWDALRIPEKSVPTSGWFSSLILDLNSLSFHHERSSFQEHFSQKAPKHQSETKSVAISERGQVLSTWGCASSSTVPRVEWVW